MNNNETLCRVQNIFNYDDPKLIAIFALANLEVTAEQLNGWTSDSEAPEYVLLKDIEFSNFLNGLIIERRGPKDGPQPEPEDSLTNNIVFKKLRIALDLKNEDLLEIFEQAGAPIEKYELSAFFRRDDHKNYRNCKDQVLRDFLDGFELKV